MMLAKTYKVAGHLFTITMEDDSFLWAKSEKSFGPFEVEECEDEMIFSMEIVTSVMKEGFELIYSNMGSAEPGFISLSAYKGSDGYLFEFQQPFSDSLNGVLHINASLSSAKLQLDGSDYEKWMTFNTAANFVFLLSTAERNTLLAHSSAVICEGKAYLFLGKSGTGKSTHSRMWISAIEGTELMNDDHPILRAYDDGKVIAYGSPWSGKTPCYRNVCAPAGGIVRITRAPENSIVRLRPLESYASLMTSCSGMTWEKNLADGKDRTLQKIVSVVPCWNLNCLPDEDAARVCYKAVKC